MIPQASDLTGNADGFQENNQINKAPELNYPFSGPNNPNECLPQFWQSFANQESSYYCGLNFHANQPISPMGNNEYVNQPQKIGNLHNLNAAQDQTIPAYNAQHNRNNALSVDAQNNLLQSQWDTNLPAAAGSPDQNREIAIPLSHCRPNLNTWTLANVPLNANWNAFPIVPRNPIFNFNASVPASANIVGGTAYYHNPISNATLYNWAS